MFLLIGMGFGCDGVGIQFDDIHSAQLIGMIALCIILYSGGLSTSFKSIKPVIAPGLVLSTLGVLLTTLFTGLFIFWLSRMPWTNIHFALMPSILLAATMSSTDSASVFGILGSQKVHLKHNLRPLLELESGSNDPMAYMLTIILIEAIQPDTTLSAGAILGQLCLQFGVGTALGFLMGYGSRWLVSLYRRIGNPREDAGQATAMSSIILLASVFFTFTLTQDLGGNGYLAVYLSGIVIGNSPIPHRRGISKFMDAITWCAQIVMFLILGLTLREMNLPAGSLVIMIKRNEQYIVPNGKRKLHAGDALLILKEAKDCEK